jgi:hypothetical protein
MWLIPELLVVEQTVTLRPLITEVTQQTTVWMSRKGFMRVMYPGKVSCQDGNYEFCH